MADLNESKVKTLLAKGKYNEAGEILNHFVEREKDNDIAWYLLGILAMKLKNYNLAHEHFERALMIKKRPEYVMFDGLAYLELLDVEEAEGRFSEYLSKYGDKPEVNFYLGVCYLLQGDPRSNEQIKKAYAADKKRTIRMLNEFFHEVIEKNPRFDESVKQQIRKRLS